MNKKNIVWWVIGILCILVAVYIVCDKIFFKENDVNFNEDEEIVLVNDKLREIGSPLGWLIIVDGISNQDENGKYNVGYGRDLLSNYGYRQLFVMEYILSYNSNYDKFTVLGMDGNIVTDIPTSDFTTAYISYDDFNEYYKTLFGEDFDIKKATKGNTKYDKDYVYYENRRAGSNGVYVSMMECDSVVYEKGEYTSNVKVTYSTRASELIGAENDTAILKYTKDTFGNINIKSFTLKDR